MPRNGSGIYQLPSIYQAVTGETITALQHNSPLLDLEADANAARSVATGGTGASTAQGARDNLGVTIGSDVQAHDSNLDGVAAATAADGQFLVGNGTTFVGESGATAQTSLGISAFAQTILDDEDAATMRATLGVNAGVTLTAGDGLTGGGTLDQNRTVDLGTPSSISNSTTNSTTPSSHTHALGFTAAEVHTGTDPDATVYPVGTMLLASMGGVTGTDRNAAVNVYYVNANNEFFSLSSSGGTQLSGTWRSRGRIEATTILVQRTA